MKLKYTEVGYIEVEDSASDGDIRVQLKTDHSPEKARISKRRGEIRWTDFRNIQTLDTALQITLTTYRWLFEHQYLSPCRQRLKQVMTTTFYIVSNHFFTILLPINIEHTQLRRTLPRKLLLFWSSDLYAFLVFLGNLRYREAVAKSHYKSCRVCLSCCLFAWNKETSVRRIFFTIPIEIHRHVKILIKVWQT